MESKFDDDNNESVNNDESPILLWRSTFFINCICENRDRVYESDQIPVLDHCDNHKEVNDHVEVWNSCKNDAFD